MIASPGFIHFLFVNCRTNCVSFEMFASTVSLVSIALNVKYTITWMLAHCSQFKKRKNTISFPSTSRSLKILVNILFYVYVLRNEHQLIWIHLRKPKHIFTQLTYTRKKRVKKCFLLKFLHLYTYERKIVHTEYLHDGLCALFCDKMKNEWKVIQNN